MLEETLKDLILKKEDLPSWIYDGIKLNKTSQSKSFVKEKDEIFGIYKMREGLKKLNNNSVPKGIEDLVKELELTQHKMIKVIVFKIFEKSIVIFTDPNQTELLGILYP